MGEYRFIPIDQIRCDGQQVRRTFREESIEGLAQSLREVGMLHPVLVAPLGDGTYRLISGERRLHAARRLGEPTVPALVVRDFKGSITQIQLIENLQREDLNPVERALAIRAFQEEEGLSKAAVSARLGIPRTTLTDWLDVLDLDPRYQAALVDNFMGGDSPLTLSHVSEAKALAARLGSPRMASVLLDAVLQYRLSKAETRMVAQRVRESENLSIEEAVRAVRGLPAQPDRDEPADDGRAPRPERGAQDPSHRAFQQMLNTLSRLRAVLAQLIGGALRDCQPEQRRELLQYLENVRRWIDDALQFARELDNPELAVQRRLQMLRAAKKDRKKRHKSRRPLPAPAAADGASGSPQPAAGPTLGEPSSGHLAV